MPQKIQISKSGKASAKNRSAASEEDRPFALSLSFHPIPQSDRRVRAELNQGFRKQDFAQATQHGDEILDFERHL